MEESHLSAGVMLNHRRTEELMCTGVKISTGCHLHRDHIKRTFERLPGPPETVFIPYHQLIIDPAPVIEILTQVQLPPTSCLIDQQLTALLLIHIIVSAANNGPHRIFFCSPPEVRPEYGSPGSIYHRVKKFRRVPETYVDHIQEKNNPEPAL